METERKICKKETWWDKRAAEGEQEWKVMDGWMKKSCLDITIKRACTSKRIEGK